MVFLSHLQPSMWVQFAAGRRFVTPDPKVYVQNMNINQTSGTATVRIWEVLGGSLRKEDSKPGVYLIENGTKRWVISHSALFFLGKSWLDVKVIPDGTLDNMPNGQDVA